MGIRSINKDNLFWRIVERLSALILALLIIFPIMGYSLWRTREGMNSTLYTINYHVENYKKNITRIDDTDISDKSFQNILDYTTWIKTSAASVNLNVYENTNYLKIFDNESQQKLDTYSEKLISDDAFSFGGMVKFIIIDKKTGTYITNEKVNLLSSQIKLFSQENGELYSYVSSKGKYYYITYDSGTSPASKYSDANVTINGSSLYVEAYWFPKDFVFTGTSKEYFNKIKSLMKENITKEINLQNADLLSINSKLQTNFIEIILLAIFEVIFTAALILLGWNRLKSGLKCSFIIRILFFINDAFDRLHTLPKLIIFGISLFSVQFLCFYIYYGRFYILNRPIPLVFIALIFIFNLVVLLPKFIIFCIQLDKIITGSKKITDGNIEYVITEKGDKSLAELAKNINKINKGFKVSIEEQITNERLKSELVANVSHDLKTPLTSIINYTDLLIKGNMTNEEREQYISILYKKSMKLKHLIEDLFEISKINSGKIKLEKSEVDVVEIINQAIVEYSDTDLYYAKNLSFNVKSFEPVIVMNLDGNKLSRVFENLINNALKYSLKDTRVFVDVEKIDRGIRILFKNTSEMPLDFDKKEILERFTRGDRSRNSEIEGSGLGLAIAKSIVELHDGILYVDFDGDLFKVIIELKKEA